MSAISFSSRLPTLALCSVVVFVAVDARAQAPFPDTSAQKCGRAVVKEVGKYLKQAQKIVDKCKKLVITKGVGENGETTLAECSVANQLVTPSPAESKLAQKRQKLLDGIAKKCGGTDKNCATPGDNVPLASYNWNLATCPDIEAGGTCANPINDCGDVGACLACLAESIVEQAEDGLLYDPFAPASFGGTDDPEKSRNKCQVTIAKEAGKFLLAKQKTLQKCWDGKLKGKTDDFSAGVICPDADVAGKTQAKIIKAESKKVKKICKACGGGDVTGAHPNFTCTAEPQGSPDPLFGDFLNDVLGGTFPCPAVVVPPNALHPAGLDCSTIDVDGLAGYLRCIDCVLEFKADCLTFAALGDEGASQLGPEYDYPTECGPGGGVGPTPTPVPVETPTPTPMPVETPTPTPLSCLPEDAGCVDFPYACCPGLSCQEWPAIRCICDQATCDYCTGSCLDCCVADSGSLCCTSCQIVCQSCSDYQLVYTCLP